MMSRPVVLLLAVTAGWFLQLERTEGFVLLVTPRFRMEFIGDLPGLDGGELFFIANNMPTPILAVQLSSGLLKFDQRYTHVLMDWFRQTPLEVVDYVMTVSSLNTTVLAQPNVTGVPLVGQVEAVFPKFNTFNTSLVCLAKGITVLQVQLVYNVTTYAIRQVNETAGDANATMNETTTVREQVKKEGYTAILRVRKECDAPTQPTVSSSPAGLSDADIAGIVVGVVLLSALVMIFILALMRRYVALQKKTRHMTMTLHKMNEYVDGEMSRNRTTTGYSGGYSAGTSNLPPMGEEELGALMTKLREKHNDFGEYLLPRDDIMLGKEIGRGAFGRVYDGQVFTKTLAEVKEGQERETLQVAVKTVKSAVRPQDIEEFMAEASLMKGFNHPNVVALIGICLEGSEPPKVCLEYMGMGDLRGYLRKSRGIGDGGELMEGEEDRPFSVETPQLLIFCLHIAQGMAYLERKKFVHRDLATRNCMLNDQLIVKIGDFGLARDINEADYYRMGTARRLPVKWMSLESLQDQIYTSMSDVWSFGIVMWEVFSLGQSPYPGMSNDELPQFLLSGKRLPRPPLCPEDLYAMMATCWSKEPGERPSFLEMTRLLVDYKDSFYANVPLKMGLEQQNYQNINPKGEDNAADGRAMSMSGGYSHAGRVATGVTYIQDSEGRLYMYSQGPQYSTQSSGTAAAQYSADSQYTGGSTDFVNPGYHLVNTNVIPQGYVCMPPAAIAQQQQQQMVVLQNPGAATADDIEAYRNVQVALTPIAQHEEPVSPTVSMATSIPPPPPTMETEFTSPPSTGNNLGEEEVVAHL